GTNSDNRPNANRPNAVTALPCSAPLGCLSHDASRRENPTAPPQAFWPVAACGRGDDRGAVHPRRHLRELDLGRGRPVLPRGRAELAGTPGWRVRPAVLRARLRSRAPCIRGREPDG